MNIDTQNRAQLRGTVETTRKILKQRNGLKAMARSLMRQ